jgi:hypothetical protein
MKKMDDLHISLIHYRLRARLYEKDGCELKCLRVKNMCKGYTRVILIYRLYVCVKKMDPSPVIGRALYRGRRPWKVSARNVSQYA